MTRRGRSQPRLQGALLLAAAVVVVVVVGGAGGASAGGGAGGGGFLAAGVRVELRPHVARLRQRASIRVVGVLAPSLEVRLVGASTGGGVLLPWVSLRYAQGAWRGSLPEPELHGLYPIELRTGPGGPLLGSGGWMLRVFQQGTLSRPSFRTPRGVAAWWVRRVARGRLVALKHWPRPGFDRREVALHQLMVVAYLPPGRWRVRDRLGKFVTAVRDGYHGRWRLLETTVLP